MISHYIIEKMRNRSKTKSGQNNSVITFNSHLKTTPTCHCVVLLYCIKDPSGWVLVPWFPCSLVPFQNCPVFPPSHRISLFFICLTYPLITLSHYQHTHLVVPAYSKTRSCALVPYDIFPFFPRSPKPLGDPLYLNLRIVTKT